VHIGAFSTPFAPTEFTIQSPSFGVSLAAPLASATFPIQASFFGTSRKFCPRALMVTRWGLIL
jgi:hypothetical protein